MSSCPPLAPASTAAWAGAARGPPPRAAIALPTADEAAGASRPRLACPCSPSGGGRGRTAWPPLPAAVALLTAPPPAGGDDEGRQCVAARRGVVGRVLHGHNGDGGRKKGHYGQ